MLKETKGKELIGNERYEGYVVDLIDGIARILNFSYEFYIVPDGNYGSYNPHTKQWNGLIRELLDRVGGTVFCFTASALFNSFRKPI